MPLCVLFFVTSRRLEWDTGIWKHEFKQNI